jgi:hypothetical protein
METPSDHSPTAELQFDVDWGFAIADVDEHYVALLPNWLHQIYFHEGMPGVEPVGD